MTAGWKTKKLADLATIELGKTPSRADASLWDDARVTDNVWLSIADLLETTGNVVSDSKEYVSKKGAALCKIVPKGTLLVSFKLTLGRLAFAGRDLFTNEAIAALSPFNEREVSKEYLYYFFQHFDWDAATEGDVKLKGKTLNKAKLKEIELAYPPLPEQQRIVGILDEAFAAIATAKANTEQNLTNARTVLNSYLDTLLRGGEATWPHRRLGDIVTRLTNGYVGPTRNIYLETGVPYLLARHVKNNRLAFDGRTFVSDEFNRKHRKSTLKAGDVLLVQSGHIGHSAVVPAEHAGHNCHAMIVITPVDGVLTGPYLSLLFNSIMRPQLEAIKTGSTVPHLNCGSVIELQIPLPDVSVQLDLVRKSSLMSEELDRLEALAQQKLAALDALKKSLLHQAFTGQLTGAGARKVLAGGTA